MVYADIERCIVVKGRNGAAPTGLGRHLGSISDPLQGNSEHCEGPVLP